MLVTRRGEQLVLATHPEHGRLAGALSEHWGNDRFKPVAAGARRALLIAATHHDDGWHELDGQPVYNADAWRPAHFLELALPQTAGPYGRGVDSVYARDTFGGALVSMHWAGLYRTRWGVQGGSPVEDPIAAQIVDEQERRWIAALGEAWAGVGLRSAFEADAWHAYDVLQTLDFVSLALGLLDVSVPTVAPAAADLDAATDADTDTAADAMPMQSTLRLVDQPPGARLIPRVPHGPGDGYADVRLWVAEPGRVVLDPFPFGESEFDVELPCRELDDRRYTEDEATRAFHEAAVRPLEITVAPVG